MPGVKLAQNQALCWVLRLSFSVMTIVGERCLIGYYPKPSRIGTVAVGKQPVAPVQHCDWRGEACSGTRPENLPLSPWMSSSRRDRYHWAHLGSVGGPSS